MNPFDVFFHRKITALLAEERRAKLESLLIRKSEPDYLFAIGYIRALSDILERCEEVRAEITSPEKD